MQSQDKPTSSLDRMVKDVQKAQAENMQKAFASTFPEHLVMLAKTVLNNPHGRELLAELEKMFIKKPICPPGCVEGYGYWRDGQASVVLTLERLVDMEPVKTKDGK